MNSRERTVLIFLVAVLLAGAGIGAYRSVRQRSNLQRIDAVWRADSALSSLPSPDPGRPAPDSQSRVLIDLNSASAAELDLLPGIGPALTQRIIDYRNTNKGFRTKDDLLKVSGIGPKKYAALKDRVTVSR